MISVSLLLLQLLNSSLKISNVLLDNYIFSFKSLLIQTSLLPVAFHLNKFITSCSQLNLQICSCCCCLSLSLSIFTKVTLLSFKLFNQSFLVLLHGNVFSLKLLLGLNLFQVCAIGFVCFLFQNGKLLFKVDLTNEWPGLLDDDEPTPASQGLVFPQVSLDYLHEFSLVKLLLVNSSLDPTKALTLHPSNKFEYNSISLLL